MRAKSAQPTTITVIGEATVTSRPDTLVLVLGIQSAGATVGEALKDNDARTRQLGETLRKLGLNPAEMQATGMDIIPQYKTPAQPGGEKPQKSNTPASAWPTGPTNDLFSIIGLNTISWVK